MQIEQWWRRWGNAANIGIATGAASGGLLVLDIDPPNGEASLEQLLGQNGLLPTTVEVRTGRGRQLYFRATSEVVRNSAGMLGVGLDIRGDGGYVVAPPSRHVTRRDYSFATGKGLTDVQIEEVPQLLLAKLRAPERTAAPSLVHSNGNTRKRRYGNKALERAGAEVASAEEGARNDTLNREAFSIGQLVGAGLLQRSEVQQALGAAAMAAGLSEHEISATLRSGLDAGEKEPRGIPESATTEQLDSEKIYADSRQADRQNTTEPRFEITESGTAERLIFEHGQNIRFCEGWGKWLTWDGKRWRVEGATGRVQRFLKKTLRRARTEAARAGNKEMVAWFFGAEKRSTRDNIVSLSRHEAEVQVEPEDLDANPMLFNCSNGTIDLKTAELRPHQRSDLITQITPVDYIPSAKCPRWQAFLDRIFAGDGSLIAFVQRVAGYSLTGAIREHVLFVLWGGGANGKSTFLLTLLALLGRYGRSGARDLLLARTHEQHPTELADLFGARFVVCHETNEEQRFDESKVKALTGGDRIKARRMREDFWEFSPTHKLWLGTNHRPAIRGTDAAIWRRIHLVPFEVTIPVEERDGQLCAKLKQELPGILKWALDGCLAWQRQGLNPPAKVLTAIEEYRQTEDRFGAFIADCCVVGPRYHAVAAALYAEFKKWAEVNGEPPLTANAFGRKLSQRAFQPITIGHKKVRGWSGIGLRTDAGESAGSSSMRARVGSEPEAPSASARMQEAAP